MPIHNAKIINFATTQKQQSCVNDQSVNTQIELTPAPIKLTIDPDFLVKAKKFANQYDFVELLNDAINQHRNKQF